MFGCMRLDDGTRAAPAGISGAPGDKHAELGRHYVQPLGDILADLTNLTPLAFAGGVSGEKHLLMKVQRSGLPALSLSGLDIQSILSDPLQDDRPWLQSIKQGSQWRADNATLRQLAYRISERLNTAPQSVSWTLDVTPNVPVVVEVSCTEPSSSSSDVGELHDLLNAR